MKKMMLLILFATLVSIAGLGQAKPQPFYVAAKSGLTVRDKPDLNAKALDKIPYGEKITIDYPEIENKVVVEGFRANWVSVIYKGKKGFIADAFLFNTPPPKAGTKDLKQYLLQITTPFGLPLKIAKNKPDQDSYFGVEKQLYKNGGERHEYSGYEYGSELFSIPGFNVMQAYQLLRLLPDFKTYVAEKDFFPQKPDTIKTDMMEKTVRLTEQSFGENNVYTERLRIEIAEGGVSFLEIYMVEDQVVIHFGSGV